MKASRLLIALSAICAACSSDPIEPIPTPTHVTSFSFLDGSWSVASTYINLDGSTDQTTAQAVLRTSIQGRVRKEHWVGSRNGAPLEVMAMFVASDNNGQWIVARGDGGAGTFDVMEGAFSLSVGTFSSRPGTRPDGGQTRETFSEIEEDSFEWQAERSTDGGVSWETYWTMEYTRVTPGIVVTSPGPAAGCATTTYREFDFWEGNWSVGAATNNLRSLLGGCILEENWSGSEIGTSFNMYDARAGLWTQVWRDDNDFTLVISGGIEGNRMVLTGPRLGSLQRITWTPNPDETVRQHGETSTNDGQTWATSYDLTYIKQ